MALEYDVLHVLLVKQTTYFKMASHCHWYWISQDVSKVW